MCPFFKLMDEQYISLCQCHLSPGLKMAHEIKACLTGSVINATLKSCSTATAAEARLHALSLLLPHLPPLSLTLSGDVPCVSSSEQRKPKTRKILLKGVSRQPDINIVLVCRAECKPKGLCGFIRVCRSICSGYIFMYHVSHLCHEVFLMLETIPHQLIVAVSNSFYMDVFVSHISFFLTSRHSSLSSAAWHKQGERSPKILLF